PVIDNLHAAAAQHETWTHEDGIPDLLGDRERTMEVECCSVARCKQTGIVENFREQAALLCQVDRLGSRTEDGHACGLEPLGEAERSLAAELHNNADEVAALA